jgi:hypothetical protein
MESSATFWQSNFGLLEHKWKVKKQKMERTAVVTGGIACGICVFEIGKSQATEKKPLKGPAMILLYHNLCCRSMSPRGAVSRNKRHCVHVGYMGHQPESKFRTQAMGF